MNGTKSWKQWLLAGLLLGAMVVGAIAVFPHVTFAQSDDGEQPAPTTPWGPGMRFGWKEIGGSQYQQFLAEALGITVEELQAAQLKAQNAMIDKAVEDGYLTQEQADLLKAQYAFRQYLSGQAQQSLEDALNAAVEAGALTQEQADLLRNAQSRWGLRGFGGRGMFGEGFHGGRGFHFRGMMPGSEAPAPTPDANS
ncbi:MAG: YckD family protein [Caldilinea sp.]|nr:YckD family protein [Caldilinea sp.]MDW8441345.1 DUF2680 domain-containing protein [Caldilineaceae bacterium]